MYAFLLRVNVSGLNTERILNAIIRVTICNRIKHKEIIQVILPEFLAKYFALLSS